MADYAAPRIERLVSERETDIAWAIAEDLGRGPIEAFLGDIAVTKSEAAYARSNVRKWMRRRLRRLPLHMMPGLAVGPVRTARGRARHRAMELSGFSHLVSAGGGGGCGQLRSSETVRVGTSDVEFARQADPEYLDSEAIAVVEGDGHTTQQLLAQGFDHAFFTGGTEIGQKVMAGAAAQLTPVTLELGGKSPAIVAKDADLAVTARRIAWAKLVNSGQTCIAPDYVLVERAVRDQFVQMITSNMKAFRAQENSWGMRIVNKRQFDRLTGYLTDTNAEIVLGGNFDRSSLTIEPTHLRGSEPG